MRLTSWIGDLGSGLATGLGEGLGLSDPVIRLGVTGLSRAGKTVFITSLVANLMDRGRMPQLLAAADGSIEAAWLQPQPDDTVARFAYEDHLAHLTASDPSWPEGTRRISQLRLSFRLAPRGVAGLLRGAGKLHLDIVDYPGEWLLDLALMEKSFAQWSADMLAHLPGRPGAQEYQAALAATDPAAPFDPVAAESLARAWGAHLQAAREAGFSDCSPGRFLMPGDLEGSPALTFAPLPDTPQAGRRSLWRECERRYDTYRARIVTPFFRDHFARIDRQIVLVDVLGALARGPEAFDDLRRTMGALMAAFRPGRTAWLARLMGMRRIDKVLLAATKADHLHHSQHPRLAALTEALLREARDRADFAGAHTASMAIASLRTTVEDELRENGQTLPVVRGRLAATGRQAAFHPGDLPEDPRILLASPLGWAAGDYAFEEFVPAPLTLRPGEGPPHIRLDRAAEFLLGDLLR